MLDTLRRLIADSLPVVPEPDPPIDANDIRVVACILLLEIAHADKRLSREERGVILRSLVSYFGVDERGALELIAEADRQWAGRPEEAVLTQRLVATYDADQRRVLADLLWDVAEADGWFGLHEAMLTARLEQWLGVKRGGDAATAAHPVPLDA